MMPRQGGPAYCAPGKVVVSGAYAVLYGAPAIVSAVDRYVLADATRPAEFVTPEVQAALGDAPAPWFDARALRDADRKLGLGSSAAILVASLGAHFDDCSPTFIDQRIFPMALRAHQQAQQGGSGVDVAIACYGGTRELRRIGDRLEHDLLALPQALVVEVWSSDSASSTSAFVAEVRKFEERDPVYHERLIRELSTAAQAATQAARSDSIDDFLSSLMRQLSCLEELGRAARIPIVTQQVSALSKLAQPHGLVLPAGAGGGDIALYVGRTEVPNSLEMALPRWGHRRLSLRLGARGLHREIR